VDSSTGARTQLKRPKGDLRQNRREDEDYDPDSQEKMNVAVRREIDKCRLQRCSKWEAENASKCLVLTSFKYRLPKKQQKKIQNQDKYVYDRIIFLRFFTFLSSSRTIFSFLLESSDIFPVRLSPVSVSIEKNTLSACAWSFSKLEMENFPQNKMV
jgi:hypothetical protein